MALRCSYAVMVVVMVCMVDIMVGVPFFWREGPMAVSVFSFFLTVIYLDATGGESLYFFVVDLQEIVLRPHEPLQRVVSPLVPLCCSNLW